MPTSEIMYLLSSIREIIDTLNRAKFEIENNLELAQSWEKRLSEFYQPCETWDEPDAIHEGLQTMKEI